MSIRTLRWSRSLIKVELTRGRSSPSTHRQYSSVFPGKFFPSSINSVRAPVRQEGLVLRPPPLSCSSSRYSPTALASAPFVRFASTTPGPRSTIAAQPVLESPVATPIDTLPDLQDLAEIVRPPEVERHIGYLKELGLDFGWGFTAFTEWLVEHIYVFTGLPWWASIVLAAVAIRIAIFKTYVASADTSARLLIIKPQIQEVKERVNEAKRAGDLQALTRHSQEIHRIYAAAGIKIWKSFLPFANVPLGFGFFRLTRNMAELPVPGLENGGLLWFTDLTVSDPFFILPLGTGVMTYMVFKAGGEFGNTANLSDIQMKIGLWAMPAASILFTCFWPAALQITFFFASCMSMVQARLFKQPWFRNFWNIHPLPPKVTPAPQLSPGSALRGMMVRPSAPPVPPEPEVPQGGVFGNARSKLNSTVSNIQKRSLNFVQSNNKGKPTRRRSESELKEARRYDEKRRKEIEEGRVDKSQHPRR